MKERASMAVSLIQGKQFIGMPMAEVKEMLGDYTGYFFSDRVPAYLIHAGWEKNENTWSLVFLPGFNGTIKDVRIHKNCCSDALWKERGIAPPRE